MTDNRTASSESQDDRLRQYLLGELSGPLRREVEERLMTDGGLHELLLMVEDELIDDYVRGTLSEGELEGFDRSFLNSPERLEKIRLGRALSRYAAAQPTEPASQPRDAQSSWWTGLRRALEAFQLPALVAALLLLTVGGWWMMTSLSSVRQQLDASQASQTEMDQQNQDLQSELKQARTQSSDLADQLAALREQVGALEGQVGASPSLLTVSLQPGLVRSTGTTKRISPASGLSLLQLRLEIGEAEHGAYIALLRSSQGQEIAAFHALNAQPGADSVFVVVNLTSDLLSRGDYSIRLEGVGEGGNPEFIDSFHFRISN